METCVGLDEVNSTISVYQNPFNETLNILWDNAVEATFIMTDMNGKSIRNGALAEGLNQINTAELPAGMYVVRILSGVQTYVVRLVK